MADTRFNIAKLNNANFQVWKCKVELLLTREDLWHTIDADRPAAPDAQWLKADRQARATIGLLIEDDQLRHIRNATNAKEAWTALQAYHQKASLTNQVFLFKKIFSMKLSENGDMEKHLNAMLNSVDQLAALGETLKDKMIIALILCSLPESYNTLITALETRNEDELTVELVKSKLLDEDSRRRNTKDMDEREDKALKTQSKKFEKTSMSNKNVKNITCFFCQKTGHVKKDCRKYMKWKAAKEKEKANQAVNENKDTQICFGVRSGCNSTQTWYIDSGATSHMTNDKNFFEVLNTGRIKNVMLANGDSADVHGVGDGYLICKDDKGKQNTILVKDVLYVPTLEENLLSVRKLTEKDFQVKFTGKICNIIKDKVTVATADISENLYRLQFDQKALIAGDRHRKDCQHTWHRKLGHRNQEAIEEMEKKNLATDFKITDCGIRGTCKVCIKGKMTRQPFPKKSWSKTEDILDLVHTDVCGPMQTKTPGNKRYVLTLIDDYSRYTVVYLLEQKSEVTEKIQDYVKNMKTKFNKIPKVIRSDKGREYVNANLTNYLRKEGTEVQYTVGYAPEQNGVAERRNRYLMEMTRCMLIDAGLPNKYWGEAVCAANYLQNRLITKATGVTPFEKWHKKKPSLLHIHTFGSRAYAHVPKELRRKLDDKAKEYVFVGYAENAKGYRLLDTNTDKIIISRDVNFLEEEESNEVIIEIKKQEEQHDEESARDQEGEVKDSPNSKNQGKTKTLVQEEKNNEGDQQLRRSQRLNKGIPPDRYCNLAYHTRQEENAFEPDTYEEAIASSNSTKWIKGMNEEYDSLMKAGTWTLVDKPIDKNVVNYRWIYKAKTDAQGHITRYKARLVAQGYTQEYGVDYEEVFAPVVRQTTFRTLLAVAGKQKLTVRHLDVKNAFLNGVLEETIYMAQPRGFEVKGSESKVCRLNKNIYGLKQAAKVWNDKLNSILIKEQYEQSQVDLCLYSKRRGSDTAYIIIYVDDIIIASNNVKYIDEMYKKLNNFFELVDLGNINYYLGIEIIKNEDDFYSINQTCYIDKLLKIYGMDDAKDSEIPLDVGYGKREDKTDKVDVKQYQKLIGALIYLATNTRVNIAASVSILSRKMNCPTHTDWIEAKRVIRYLKGTKHLKLVLGSRKREEKGILLGYSDADWAQDVEDRKSNTGYLFKFNGGTVSWACRKQSCVALSSTKAEYIALAETCQEAVWLRNLLKDFNEEQTQPTVIFEDNQSCIKLVNKDKYSKRTKHVSTKYHFVKNLKDTGITNYLYCPTEVMVADILTKPLARIKLMSLRQRSGLIDK